MKIVGALAATVVGLMAGSAAAQESVDIRAAQLFILERMDQLVCEAKRCEPANPEELARPPVPDEVARAVYARGAISAGAEHCGLDWQGRNFLPMMAHYRNGRTFTVRQMAIVGTLHGLAQGSAEAMFKGRSCTPAVKAAYDSQLNFKP